MSKKQTISAKFQNLLDIMKKLRSKNGCPWDKEQTRHSLKPYLIEEAYEVLDALDSNDDELIKEELGDLLLQIIFHAEISEEEKLFDIEDVISAITEKLIRRHPHVFEGKKVSTSKEVLANWNQIKLKEKEKKSKQKKSVLGDYPKGLPLLHKALRITDKASKVGFDWPDVKSVMLKVEEELAELKEALKKPSNKNDIENEIGDLMFGLVNLARFLEINPEIALRGSLQKFIRRFEYIEKVLAKKKLSFNECKLDYLEKIWNEAKRKNL